MKIMLLIPHVADGGAEKIVSELSRNLRADEIVVVVFEKKIAYPCGGRLISLDLPIRHGTLNRAAGLLRRKRRLSRVIRQERPDVVISFMGEANVLNALVSPRPIITIHNHLSSLGPFVRSRLETASSEFLFRKLFRRARVVAVSNAVKKEMIEVFKVPARQVVVIPNAVNGIEIQEKAAEPAETPWDPSLPVIVTAGRLTAQKGQWHLIRAFAHVRRRIPCQLAILGTGELEGRLREAASAPEVSGHVYFLGWQANPWKFMARADLFMLPSLTEGFGLVLLEAMACGLPVISTDCPGAARDILAPTMPEDADIRSAVYAEYGVIVPVAAEEQIAEAIVRLLEDQDLFKRYVQAGMNRIRDFDYSVFLDRYQRLINSTMEV